MAADERTLCNRACRGAATGDVKEFEKGQNPGVSSRVQAVCDYFGPTDFTLMNSYPPRKATEQ